jgi:uncharacterized glyoxalase superfamily protein PhnB
MAPSKIMDLKPFVPARDFELAKRFYADLGFALNRENSTTAEFRVGSWRFLLQNFYVRQFAENFMMHLMVEDVDRWWKHLSGIRLQEKYPGIVLKAPELQKWGLRVPFLTDPTGVLWHIADERAG